MFTANFFPANRVMPRPLTTYPTKGLFLIDFSCKQFHRQDCRNNLIRQANSK